MDPQYRAVIVGYGAVGRTVTRLLREQGIEPAIVEMNLTTVQQLRAAGVKAFYGDATLRATLEQAGVGDAGTFILSVSGLRGAEEVIRLAREINPRIHILARTRYLADIPAVRRAGADRVFSGEGEVALAMTESVLADLGATPNKLTGKGRRYTMICSHQRDWEIDMIPLQRVLFSVAAGFWLVIGALAMFGIVDLGFGSANASRVLGLLMLGNGVALGLAGWLSLRGHRLVDYGALAVVALNALLSVTDEIGVLDVVSLLVNGALLVLLVVNLRAQRRNAKDEKLMDADKVTSIPKADTIEAIGDFWDTHDFTDFDSDGPDVEFRVSSKITDEPPR